MLNKSVFFFESNTSIISSEYAYKRLYIERNGFGYVSRGWIRQNIHTIQNQNATNLCGTRGSRRQKFHIMYTYLLLLKHYVKNVFFLCPKLPRLRSNQFKMYAVILWNSFPELTCSEYGFQCIFFILFQLKQYVL